MKRIAQLQLIPNWLIGTLIALFIAILLLTLSIVTGFHIGINDFWGFLFLADQLDFQFPQRFYNGLFPIAYPAFLRVLLFFFKDVVIEAAFLVNYIACFFICYQLWRLGKGHLKANWAFICFPLFLLPSESFYMLQQPGPYSWFNFGCLVAFQQYLRLVRPKAKWHISIYVGLLFGLASLFRIHAFLPLMSILLIHIGTQLWMNQKAKPLIYQVLGMIIGYLSIAQIQIWLNIYAGYDAFQTNHSFVHTGVDWLQFSPESSQLGLLEAIQKHPSLFFHFYLRNLFHTWPWTLPSVCLLILYGFNRQLAKKWVVISLIVLLYTAVVRLHTTHRWLLPILPLCCLQIGFLAQNFWEKSRYSNLKYAGIAVILVVFFFAGNYVRRHHYAFLKEGNKQQVVYQQLAEILKKEEGKQLNSMSVFSNELSLYLPTIYPFKTYGNGGWLRGIDWVYEQVAPNIHTENYEEFLQDCQQMNPPIRYLILTEQANGFLEETFSNSSPTRFQLIGEINQYRIFKIRNGR